MSNKNIQSILVEQRSFPPAEAFTAGARLKPAELEARDAAAAEDYEGYWADLARNELQWATPFTQTLDESKAPNYRWFTDGELNVSANCLDVHITDRGDKPAIIFESESGERHTLT